jgi:hypothetical protein
MNVRIIAMGAAAVVVLGGSALIVQRLAAKPAATIITTTLNQFCMGAVNGDEQAALAALHAVGFTPLKTGTNPRAATAEGGWIEMARFPGEPKSHGCLMRLSPDQKSANVLPLLTAFAQRNKMDAAPVSTESTTPGDTVTHFAALYPVGTLHLLYRDRPDMAADPKDPQADVADTVMLYVDSSAAEGR